MTESMFVFDKKLNMASQRADSYTRSGPIPAGYLSRFLAFSFDAILIYSLLICIEIVLGYFAIHMSVYSLLSLDNIIAWHLSYWTFCAQAITFIFYANFYLIYSASPGKMVFGLKVIDSRSSGDLSLTQIFLREIVGKFYSALFLGIGYLFAFFTKDRQALHDLIARSLVVREVSYEEYRQLI